MLIRLTTFAFLPIALITTFPIAPAWARNQFDVCASQLLRSGIPGDEAAISCAQALEPSQLSECVLDIQDQTPVAAEAALRTCFRVRRPLELSSCVVQINDDALKPYIRRISTINPTPETTEENIDVDTVTETEPSDEVIEPIALLALDTCRRSLLPQRHSECVVALSREIPDLSPANALETCIEAESFPPELYPEITPGIPPAGQ